MPCPRPRSRSRGPCSGGRRRRAKAGGRDRRDRDARRRRARARIDGIACAPFGTRARDDRPSTFTSVPMPPTIRSASATRPFCSASSTLTDSPRRSRFSSSGVPSTTTLPRLTIATPLGEPVGLLEVVRREQDREVLLRGQPLDLHPHRGARLRVEAGRRLVEEEHLRLVDEPDRDVEPALHPAGVAAGRPVGRVLQPDEPEQLVHAGVQRLPRHAVDPPLQEQVLAAGRRPSRRPSPAAT